MTFNKMTHTYNIDSKGSSLYFLNVQRNMESEYSNESHLPAIYDKKTM